MACLGFVGTKPTFGPPRPPSSSNLAGYPINVIHGSLVSGPEPRPLNVDLNVSLSPPCWGGSSDCGLFDKLALELRERIWEFALIQRLSKYDQELYEEMRTNEHGLGEWDYQDSMDYFAMKEVIFQGSSCGGSGLIRENLGLLLANKQIHAEASKVFYSNNTFCFLSTTTEIYHAPDITTRIPSRHFQHIQHVMIKLHSQCSNNHEDSIAFNRLVDLSREFHRCGNRIKTVQLDYRNEFGGELGRLLHTPYRHSTDDVEAVPLRDMNDNVHLLKRYPSGKTMISHSPSEPFHPLCWAQILDPLLALSGKVEDIVIRADLPPSYTKQISDQVTRGAQITPAVQKMKKEREDLAAVRKDRDGPDGNEELETFPELMRRLGKTVTMSSDWLSRPIVCDFDGNTPESLLQDFYNPGDGAVLRQLGLDGGFADEDDDMEDYLSDSEEDMDYISEDEEFDEISGEDDDGLGEPEWWTDDDDSLDAEDVD